MYAGFKSEGAFTPDTLVIEVKQGRKVLIKGGSGIHKRGSVIGKDADKKFQLSVAAATDGTEVPDAILADDVDATGPDDVEAIAFFECTVNQSALILGGGHTLGSIDDVLRTKGIWLQSVVR